MKVLNLEQTLSVSGAAQYLLATSKVEFSGIPENCIEQYYNANKDSLSQFMDNVLTDNIISQCPELWTTGSFSTETDWLPISISLVER